MNKRKKPVRIGILRTDDFIVISITMFNKTKWKWIRRDTMECAMLCVKITLITIFLQICLLLINQW